MSGPIGESFPLEGKGQFEERVVCAESVLACLGKPVRMRKRWREVISSGEQFSRLKGSCCAEQGDQMSFVHGDAGTKGSEFRELCKWVLGGAVDCGDGG